MLATEAHGQDVRVDTIFDVAPDAAPTLGNPHAPLTLELFFVPGQYNTRLAMVAAVGLMARHPEAIRLRLRPTGSREVGHALLAMMRQRPEAITGLLTSLPVDLSAGKLLALAAAQGYDVGALEQAIESRAFAAQLSSNQQAFEAMRTRLADVRRRLSTPVFFMGTGYVEASMPNAVALLDELYAGQVALRSQALRGGLLRAPPESFWRYVAPPSWQEPQADLRLEVSVHLAADALMPGLSTTQWIHEAPHRDTAELALACDPLALRCRIQQGYLRRLREQYPSARVAWLPTPSEAHPNTEAMLVVDALWCAHAAGVLKPWLEAWRALARGEGLPQDAGEASYIIKRLAAETHQPFPSLAACLARHAGYSVRQTAALRQLGVSQLPALIVHGRYVGAGVSDYDALARHYESGRRAGLLHRLTARE